MTKEELARLPALKREVTRTKERIAKLRGMATPDDLAAQAAVANLIAVYERYLARAAREEAVLLQFVERIDDPDVRELFLLRYADGIRSWQRIAFAVGEHDESFVRRRHNAYLKKYIQRSAKE